MLKFKLVVLIAFCFAPMAAFADESKPDFEKKKSEILSHIDGRLEKMQEHKSCVQSASNHEALEKCHDSMKGWMKEHAEHMKGKMKRKMEKLEEKLKD